MITENAKIRRMARAADVPLWRIAAALKVSEPTFTRWLRFPLDVEKETKIINAIKELSREAS